MLDWYAIYTVAGEESDAERFLRKRWRTFFPHTTEWIGLKTRRSKLVRRAWFPTYLFLAAERAELGQAICDEAKCWGVRGLVAMPGQEPYPIPERFMMRLMAKADPLGCMHVKEPKEPPAFAGKVGDRVNILEGHYLWNFQAVVRAVEGDELVIELDRPMLGKSEATIPARYAEVICAGSPA
jgi:transcription antitermination factor NusG